MGENMFYLLYPEQERKRERERQRDRERKNYELGKRQV
jgi:hypothetical protein